MVVQVQDITAGLADLNLAARRLPVLLKGKLGPAGGCQYGAGFDRAGNQAGICQPLRLTNYSNEDRGRPAFSSNHFFLTMILTRNMIRLPLFHACTFYNSI